MAWIDPIYDRDNSAHYNASDLNRVENNCECLAEILGVTVSTRQWVRSDIPTTGQFERILNNINLLRTAYYTYLTTPPTPQNPINIYTKANDIEKILLDVFTLYNENSAEKQYAGEAYSGQQIGVI